ncbi:hypothetical protein [Archaeoglobus sulfaticallidus]|nr:hypothetical protein [Archaeoglobus sulfaticallidus]
MQIICSGVDNGEVTIRLKIPEEILKQVDLNKVVERLEKEIMLEYNLKKLHGKLRGKNLEKLLEEIEDEWGI